MIEEIIQWHKDEVQRLRLAPHDVEIQDARGIVVKSYMRPATALRISDDIKRHTRFAKELEAIHETIPHS